MLREENLATRKLMLEFEKKEEWGQNNRIELLMGAVGVCHTHRGVQRSPQRRATGLQW